MRLFKSKSLAIFCGAGISHNSGIPLANTIKWDILNQLVPTCLTNRDADISYLMESKYPFEAFVQALRENGEISPIYNIFSSINTTPNNTHCFIAKAAKENYLDLLATMNIDLLLETALENVGIPTRPYYNDIEFNRLSNEIARLPNVFRLIKLHGTASDHANLGIILDTVSNRGSVKRRKKLVERIFETGSHSAVLVMGYSCSDIFDIIPIIQNLRKRNKNNSLSKRILFVEHLVPTDSEETILKKRDSFKEMFGDFNSLYARIDTDTLIKSIQVEMGWEIKDTLSFNNGWYFKNIDTYKNSNPIANLSSVGTMLLENGQSVRALHYFDEAASIANNLMDQILKAKLLSTIGFINVRTGNFKKSIELQMRAIDLFKVNRNRQLESIAYGRLGLACEGISDFDSTIKYHKQALKIARAIGDERLECRHLGNLGLALWYKRNFQSSIRYSKMALQISQKLGIALPKELG